MRPDLSERCGSVIAQRAAERQSVTVSSSRRRRDLPGNTPDCAQMVMFIIDTRSCHAKSRHLCAVILYVEHLINCPVCVV